jgi:drug/metabolite transporter superfamily protein YnfA
LLAGVFLVMVLVFRHFVSKQDADHFPNQGYEQAWIGKTQRTTSFAGFKF